MVAWRWTGRGVPAKWRLARRGASPECKLEKKETSGFIKRESDYFILFCDGGLETAGFGKQEAMAMAMSSWFVPLPPAAAAGVGRTGLGGRRGARLGMEGRRGARWLVRLVPRSNPNTNPIGPWFFLSLLLLSPELLSSPCLLRRLQIKGS